MHKLFLALPPLALLAACAITDADPAPPPPPALASWRFTAIDGAAPVGETMLAFDGDRLIAHAGCNRMAGSWRKKNGKLVAGPLMSTKMFCEGKMDQERAVGELLSASPDMVAEHGRMTLKSAAHSAELERVD